MTWFKVDDKFHSHSKVRKVLADDPAALALWVVAGSWSSDNSTDGFVPDHQLTWLFPAGADELARKLVAARLWRRVRGGHQFHDFSDWNPLAEEVKAKKEKRAEAGRKGGRRSAEVRSGRSNKKKVHMDEDPSSEQDLSAEDPYEKAASGSRKTDSDAWTWNNDEANASANASANAQANAKQNSTPTRPDPLPSKEGGEGSAPASLGGARSPRGGAPAPSTGEQPREDERFWTEEQERNRLVTEATVMAIAEDQRRARRGAALARAAIKPKVTPAPRRDATAEIDRVLEEMKQKPEEEITA